MEEDKLQVGRSFVSYRSLVFLLATFCPFWPFRGRPSFLLRKVAWHPGNATWWLALYKNRSDYRVVHLLEDNLFVDIEIRVAV